MAVVPMSSSQIDYAQYGRETLTYTWGPATLAVGQTTVFDLSEWNNRPGQPRKVLVLEAIAATQNSQVQATWTADSNPSNPAQGWTDAMPAGLRFMRVRARARKRLSLRLNNQSGAAINNFQFNYVVTVERYPVARDLLEGVSLSQADQELMPLIAAQNGVGGLARVQNAVTQGQLPVPWERLLDLILIGRELGMPTTAVPMHLQIAAGSANPTQTIPIPGSQVGVLWGLAVEGAPAGVVVNVSRDQNTDYVGVNGAAFAGADDAPWPFFVPAVSSFVLTASGSATTVPVRPDIRLYKLSDLLALHLELTQQPTSLYAQVRAGLR
jgi:hypothetical protein